MVKKCLRGMVALAFAAGTLAAPITAQAQQAPCQFTLGFKTLHDLASDQVGGCSDNQGYASNGDGQQLTAKGLMVWRKADNWTAFTNGYQTWLLGPYGLANRLNTQRFEWEPDYGAAGFTAAPLEPAAAKSTAGDTAAALALFPTETAALNAHDGSAYAQTVVGQSNPALEQYFGAALQSANVKVSLDGEKLLNIEDGRALVQVTATTTGSDAPSFRNNRVTSNNTVIHEGNGWKVLATTIMQVQYLS